VEKRWKGRCLVWVVVMARKIRRCCGDWGDALRSIRERRADPVAGEVCASERCDMVL